MTKLASALLGLAVLCSLGLAPYIHSKRKHELQLLKQASFQDIKFRVTRDVVNEYRDQVVRSISLLDKTKRQVDEVNTEVSVMQNTVNGAKSDVTICIGDTKKFQDQSASTQAELNNVKNALNAERARWNKEKAQLKEELGQRSKVCDYINKQSANGRKLCGMGPLKEEPAAEQKVKENAPKAEIKNEPKAEGAKKP